MYNNNTPPQRRRGRRYSPGRPGRAAVSLALILTAVFAVGCIIGAFSGIGIYRAVVGVPSNDTLGTLQVIDPSSINQTTSVTQGSSSNQNDPPKLICIDPGHGFYDGGATSSFVTVTEAQINMNFSKLLAAALEKKGFEVVFTHDGVNFPSEYDYDKDEVFDEISTANGVTRSERRDLAQSLSPDYFISVHCNTYASDSRIGGMVIYYDAENQSSGKAAASLVSMIHPIERTYPMSVPAKAEGNSGNDVYAVTGKWGDVPALLAEIGYLTSSTDSQYFINDTWLSLVTNAYADAIAAYFS